MVRSPHLRRSFSWSRLSVRNQLFWISMALVVVVGTISGLYLERQLRRWLGERLVHTLTQQARTVRFVLKNTPHKARVSALDSLADQLGSIAKARVTIVGSKGRVLGDSRLSQKAISKISTHLMRPEVVQAKRSGKGISRRYSETFRKRMLYVAVPYQSPYSRGFVRVAVSFSEVENAIHRSRLFLLLASLIGMVVAIFMSWTASFLFARMLRNVLQNIHNIAASVGQALPTRKDQKEIDVLKDSFNKMADRLEQTISTMVLERYRFAAVLENMNAAVIALDKEQKIQLVNRSGLAMMGLDEAPLNQPLREFIQSEELLSLSEQGPTGEHVSLELTLKGPLKRQVLVRTAPLSQPGAWVMVLHDITELRRLERVRRDFIANVSHELRTPVSIIRANAETLLDGVLEEPELAEEFLQALLRHAERLSSLVSDLLDISRIEANEYRIEYSDIFVPDAIRLAYRSVEALLHNKQQTSSLDIRDDIWIHSDASAFEHILLNLLDNAIKYTPEKGHISIISFVRNEHVRVEVHDTGPGIKPKYRARVFERFYRADKGRSRDTGGTGLGLAIVKNLTETLGGSVGVAPAEQSGSIFWFELPVQASVVSSVKEV